MAPKWIFYSFLVGSLRVLARTENMEFSKSINGVSLTNLTAIKWAHAVNSQQELSDALDSSVDMIEADLILGTLNNVTSEIEIPVMGHPPKTTSDLSFDQFLKQILEYNQKNKETPKGVKLDFKSTKVFLEAIEILKSLWSLLNYQIWMNADILPGPVNQNNTKPVDPNVFLQNCKKFNSAIFSIGWTTRWGQDFLEGSYTDDNVNEMMNIIISNEITKTNHKVTFPIRAGIAANSLSQMQNLYNRLNPTNDVTFTIWSSKGDNVDILKLRHFILTFGIEKVYLDVPEEVSSQLNLDANADILKKPLI